MSTYFRQDFVTVPDGARLFFSLRGAGQPAMVLCDGLGCDGFAWKYLLPNLAERHQVLRWHYRGHGQSTLPSDPRKVGMAESCDDLVRVLDVVGIDKAVLFGHSMGVQVALEFHRQNPGRVEGLVLLCGSYGRPLDTFHNTNLLKRTLPFFRTVVEAFPRATRKVTGTLMRTEAALELALTLELNRALLHKDDLAPYFQHMSRMDPVVFLRTLESISEHSALEHLPRIDVPTLVIAGEQDHFTPAWLSEQMARSIPGAKLLMVPGGSHSAPLESPEAIWLAVESFLRGIRRAAPEAQTEAGEPRPKQGAQAR